jgi:transposase
VNATADPDLKARFLAERAALHPHPERVQDALFHDAPFFDPRDLIQVRYEMLRRHRIDGHPPARVARAFGVSRQIFPLCARAFQAGGLLGLFPRKRGPRAAHKCTDEVLAFVRARRSLSPQLSLDDLLAEVRRHLGVRLHRRTLERRLVAQGKKLRRRPNPLAGPVPHSST